jgi:hypothetical protein
MQTAYNSLSNYLIGSFNLESTELLYESFTGNSNATDSQKSAIDKLLGGLGCIFTSIFGADKKNDEDEIEYISCGHRFCTAPDNLSECAGFRYGRT